MAKIEEDNIKVKEVTILSVKNYFVTDFERSMLRQGCLARYNQTGEEFNFIYPADVKLRIPFLVEGDVLKVMTVNGVFWGLRK